MPTLEWKAEYSVGNDLIDSQHRGLLNLILRLERVRAEKGQEAEGLEVLTELVRYANNHFSTEEQLMKQAGYPGSWEHEKSHLEFREKLARLAGTIMQGHAGGWDSLLDFVHQWWRNHIMGDDREVFLFYRQYQESRAVSGA